MFNRQLSFGNLYDQYFGIESHLNKILNHVYGPYVVTFIDWTWPIFEW